MNELIAFIKKPYINRTQKMEWHIFIILLLFLFLFSFGSGFFSIPIIQYTDIHKTDIIPSWELFVFAILLAPIYEEVFFRGLFYFNIRNVAAFSSLLSLITVYKIYQKHFVFAVVLMAVIIGIIAAYKYVGAKRVQFFIKNHIRLLYYFSALSFGLLHAANFSGNIYLIIVFSLILTAPQICMGFINGFVRINFGLKYSILFHMVFNFLGILPILIKWLL